jgi:carboxylesterase type B
MIFIHGGGFQGGSATESQYEAEHIVNTTNVIVALIQYRLGKCRLSLRMYVSVRKHD